MTQQPTLERPTKRDLALLHIAMIRREQLGIDQPPDDLYRPDIDDQLSA